jgi:HNH endonuclease
VDEVWRIPTEHFDPAQAQRRGLGRKPTPLAEVLVEHSTYSRARLKARLFASGLKEPRCELCGQREVWRGVRMAMIIDHINGVPDDNRLENLRIACPNCAATFDTHCGRKNRRPVEPRACAVCGSEFLRGFPTQAHCSRRCGTRHGNRRRVPRPETRKVERPPYDVLIRETAALGFSAVSRKYGVSDNAVRKWIRWYEAHADAPGASEEPPGGLEEAA